jgi:hypothetical protein
MSAIRHTTRRVLIPLLAAGLAATSSADVRFYADRPNTNSADFRDRCLFLGPVPVRSIDFSLPPVGVLDPSFFQASAGVTVTLGLGGSASILDGVGSLAGNTTWNGTGEGRLPEPARYYHTGFGAPTPVDFTFDPPVRGFGLMTADLFFWFQGTPAARLEAFDAAGVSLGFADSFNQNFEFDYQYFMGVVDSAGRIARVRFTNFGLAGDSVYLTEAWTARGDLRCRGDFNNDGFVDFFDYDLFVQCFEGGECPPGGDADFNDDGFADFFDYDAFVARFEAGC